MALNVFKNISANLTTSGATVYTTPSGYSGIVLMAQLSNIGANTVNASLFVDKSNVKTSLVTNFAIPTKDAAGVLSGKLVLEAGQSVFASANANTSIQLTMSVLESQN
jgi:hypothetical protein